MEMFLGVKIVSAKAMTRLEYSQYRGWELPKDERGDDEGYLVEYFDSEPNHPDHKGYISWSPKEQFDKAHYSMGFIGDLPPFIQRIHGEAAQLVQNITKLTDFIAKYNEGKIENINPQYLDLMIRQRAVMETHLGILRDRLELLAKENSSL